MAGIVDVHISPELDKPIRLVVDASTAEDGELEVEVCKGSDEKINDPDVEVTKDVVLKKYDIEFTPPSPDEYTVIVRHRGEEVSGSPLKLNLSKPDYKKVVLTQPPTGKIKAGQSIDILFDTYPAGRGELTGVCKGEETGEIPVLVTRKGITSTFKVTFLPPQEDEYALSVLFAGKNLKGSPYKIDMIPVNPSKVKCSKPTIPADPTQPITMDVSTEGAGNAKLKAKCVGEKSGEVRVNVKQLSKNEYNLTFQPPKRDKFSLNVLYGGKPVKDSPFEIDIKSQPELVKVGELHVPEEAGCGEDVWVEIDCSEAGKDEVEAECKGQTKVPVDIEELDSLKYRIKFTPTLPDVYSLTILYGDSLIPGGSFEINLLPKSDSKLVKHLGTFIPDDHAAPVVLKFDAREAGKGEMRARVNGILMAGPVDSEVKCVDEETKEYELSFVPSGADTYNVDVYWSDETIPGSPIFVKIVYPNEVLVSDPVDAPELLQPVTVHVDTQYAGPGVLTASCSGKETGDIDVEIIRDEADNTKYDVSFRPLAPDFYAFRFFFNDTEIKYSPIEIEIKPVDEPCVAVVQEDTKKLPEILTPVEEPDDVNEGSVIEDIERATKLDMCIGSPLSLVVDTEDKMATVLATASGAKVGEFPVSVTPSESGSSHTVVFNPTEPDIYILNIKMDGSHIPNSPFIINYAKPKEVEPQQEVPTHPITKPYIIRYVPEDGVDDLRAHAIHDESCVRTVLTIRTKKEGATHLVFQAEKTGLHLIHILQGEKEIHGSPFKLEIVPSDPSACVVVDVPEMSFVGEETSVTIDASKAGSGDMHVVATVPVGGKDTHFYHKEKGNGKFLIQFTPKVAGKHMLNIKWDDVVIPDCPVPVNVYKLTEEVKQSRDAASRVSVYTSGNVFSSQLDHTSGALFFVHTDKAGKGKLFIKSKGPGNAKIDVAKQKDSVYACRVMPAVSGNYDLSILWNGFSIPNNPYQLNFVTNKTYIINQLDLETEKFVVDKTYQYSIDCSKQKGALEIFANPSDCAHVDVYRLKENIYTVKITPQRVGNHEISLKFSGKPIFRSPYHVQFDAASVEERPEQEPESQDKLERLSGIDFPLDLSGDLDTSQVPASLASSQQHREDAKVTAFGPGLEEGVIGQEGNFAIKTNGCGEGKLMVTIDGPRGSFKTCLRHHPDQERTVLGRYDPTHIGKYTINIQWNDQPIEGSPFEVNVKPQVSREESEF